jgi:hypothetical protein
MDDVTADLAATPLHPLLDLREERVDEMVARGWACGQAAGVARRDTARHGVMVTVRQGGRRSVRARQVERFQNAHGLLVRLHDPCLRGIAKPHGSVAPTDACST